MTLELLKKTIFLIEESKKRTKRTKDSSGKGNPIVQEKELQAHLVQEKELQAHSRNESSSTSKGNPIVQEQAHSSDSKLATQLGISVVAAKRIKTLLAYISLISASVLTIFFFYNNTYTFFLLRRLQRYIQTFRTEEPEVTDESSEDDRFTPPPPPPPPPTPPTPTPKSDGVSNNWYYIVGVIVVGLVGYFLFRSSSGRSDPTTIDRVPSDFPSPPVGSTNVFVPKVPVTRSDPGTSSAVTRSDPGTSTAVESETLATGGSVPPSESDQVSENIPIIHAYNSRGRGRGIGEWASNVIRLTLNLIENLPNESQGEKNPNDSHEEYFSDESQGENPTTDLGRNTPDDANREDPPDDANREDPPDDANREEPPDEVNREETYGDDHEDDHEDDTSFYSVFRRSDVGHIISNALLQFVLDSTRDTSDEDRGGYTPEEDSGDEITLFYSVFSRSDVGRFIMHVFMQFIVYYQWNRTDHHDHE